MARVKLDLSVPDRAKFQHALEEARTQGLEVSRSFADIGVISGTIEAKSIGALVHIDGISSIAPERRHRFCGPAKILPMRR